MSDGEAFIKDEPLVGGPMTKAPKYWLAWALETTQECNGPRDSRPPHRLLTDGGNIRIKWESGEIEDVDCDVVTPLRNVTLDKEAMDRVLASATPMLRQELCRDYIGYPEGIDCDVQDLDDAALWVETEQGYLAPFSQVRETNPDVRKLKAKLLR